MLYYIRYKEKEDKNVTYFDVIKKINLKSIPKKYRDNDILAYQIEKIKNKT
jgi:hypothetical protein